jgi:NAD(P)-dependent dehydrogenase (short-subunit alcohol dehydrogenase family)
MQERERGEWRPDGELLRGQVAVIAGGGGGIGAATSRMLAAAGAAVAVVDNDREAAEDLAATIASSGGNALAFEADLRDEAACGDVIDRAARSFGAIDILANVAGGMSRHAQWKHTRDWTTESWDIILQLNLRYVFWVCRAVIPAMEQRGGGSIVNVTSIAGAFGSPGQSAYGAAKSGLMNLTKTLAVECGQLGIRVNAVSPGVTLTDAALAQLSEEARVGLTRTTPLRTLGRPEDIASAIAFFASPMARHVTGQMLLVDGGVSVNFPYFTSGSDHF